MERDYIERLLERGRVLGFVHPTESPHFVGWIRVIKQKPHPRIPELFGEEESDDEESNYFVGKERLVRQKPYVVNVIEMNRKVIDDNRYETNEDFRGNEVHRFATLDEVAEF